MKWMKPFHKEQGKCPRQKSLPADRQTKCTAVFYKYGLVGDLESSSVVSKEDTSKFKPNHHLFVSDKKHFHIREHLL